MEQNPIIQKVETFIKDVEENGAKTFNEAYQILLHLFAHHKNIVAPTAAEETKPVAVAEVPAPNTNPAA